MWQWPRRPTAAEAAADFARLHAAQSDAEFLADCGLPDTQVSAFVALAVRRSVASYGMVAACHVRAGHAYPGELESLSGWDSLDALGWVLELERELGGARVELAWFGHWSRPRSVRDLAAAVLANWRPEDA